MSILKIKRKDLTQPKVESNAPRTEIYSMPELNRNKSSAKWPVVFAIIGFVVSVLGFSFYLKEAKSKGMAKQGQFKVTITVVDSNNLPVSKAIFKNGNRVLGEASSEGKWRKSFQIASGAEYPLLIEAQDNQGNSEAKLVKFTFPTWSKQASLVNRTIQFSRLKNKPSSAEEADMLSSANRNIDPLEESTSLTSNALTSNVEVKVEDKVGDKKLSGRLEGELAKSTSAVSQPTSSALKPASQDDLALKGKAGSDQLHSNEELNDDFAGENASLEVGTFPKSIWVTTAQEVGLQNDSQPQSLLAIKDAILFRAKALGLTGTETSPFKIFLKPLSTKVGEVTQNLVEVSVTFQGKHMGRFLRNYQENAIATARLILWRSHLEIPVSYTLKKSGDKFQVSKFETPSKLWQLSEGNVVQDKQGKLATVVDQNNQDGYFSLSAPEEFCSMESNCIVQLVDEEGTPKDWSRRSLRILGLGSRDVTVYAGGNPCPKVQGEFIYRGLGNGFTIFTIVEKGEIIYRNAQHNNLYQQTIISLPLPAISAR
jgi:hypothetical protein